MIEPEMMSSFELQRDLIAFEKSLSGLTKFFDNAILLKTYSVAAVCLHEAYVVSQKDLIQKIPLGFGMNVPAGWEARLRCRSGVALRGAIVHHGTIDSSFTGEVNAIVSVVPGFRLHICPGDRLAQLTFAPVYRPRFELVDELPPCRGGFGSTGR